MELYSGGWIARAAEVWKGIAMSNAVRVGNVEIVSVLDASMTAPWSALFPNIAQDAMEPYREHLSADGSQITDPSRPMGRFMTRRGGETLYMCYIEVESVHPICERLDKKGMRYARGGENTHNPDNMFLHPATLHGVLMGCSRTNAAWVWSGHPELYGKTSATH